MSNKEQDCTRTTRSEESGNSGERSNAENELHARLSYCRDSLLGHTKGPTLYSARKLAEALDQVLDSPSRSTAKADLGSLGNGYRATLDKAIEWAKKYGGEGDLSDLMAIRSWLGPWRNSPRKDSGEPTLPKSAPGLPAPVAEVLEVPLNDKYLRALDELCRRKDMSRPHLVLMALRWLQLLELTPGAYEAVNALRPTLGFSYGCMGDD